MMKRVTTGTSLYTLIKQHLLAKGDVFTRMWIVSKPLPHPTPCLSNIYHKGLVAYEYTALRKALHNMSTVRKDEDEIRFLI